MTDEERAETLVRTLDALHDKTLGLQQRYRTILAAFAAARAEGEGDELRRAADVARRIAAAIEALAEKGTP